MRFNIMQRAESNSAQRFDETVWLVDFYGSEHGPRYKVMLEGVDGYVHTEFESDEYNEAAERYFDMTDDEYEEDED